MNDKLIKIGKAVWQYIKDARVELIVLVAALVLDLLSKAIVAATIPHLDSVTVIPNLLNFTYIHNKNAAFGSSFGLNELLGETGTRTVFIIVTIIAVGFFGFFMVKNRKGHIVCRLAFALIIGGALGNLYDRAFIGFVRDFIEIVYLGLTIFGSKSFAIFNIADAALVVGVVMFAVYYIFIYKEPKKEETTVADQTEEDNGNKA